MSQKDVERYRLKKSLGVLVASLFLLLCSFLSFVFGAFFLYLRVIRGGVDGFVFLAIVCWVMSIFFGYGYFKINLTRDREIHDLICDRIYDERKEAELLRK